MDEIQSVGFEEILHSTLRMIRTTWKVPVTIFIQIDDEGSLQIRGAEGLPKKGVGFRIKRKQGLVAQALDKNRVMESGKIAWDDGLADLLKGVQTPRSKFVVVPVTGQSRVLGALVLGPLPAKENLKAREAELRSAGALCAVLSAYWRLYEWMTNFIPTFNQELRTPLTAVQGSLGMVLGGVFGDVGGDVKEMLQMAHKGCERTVLAIEEYLNKQDPAIHAPQTKSKIKGQKSKGKTL